MAYGQTEMINGNMVIVGHVNACTSGPSGGTDAYACTLDHAITAYQSQACYGFVADVANTGTASLNLHSLGARTIVKSQGGITTTLADNDIRAGMLVRVCFDGTNMQCQNCTGNVPGGAPGGSTGQAQYNSAGTLGGSSGLSLDATTQLSMRDRATTKNATGTLGTSDGPTVACTSGASDVTLTLPGASATTQGRWTVVKVDSGAGRCLVAPGGADTINGVAGTLALASQWTRVDLSLTSTTNWSGSVGVLAVDLATQVTGDLPYANLTPATAASRLLGRGSASAGDWQELTLGSNLSLSGTALNAGTNLSTRGLVFELGDETASAALATTAVSYATVPFSCTIGGYALIIDVADATVRVKFWRVATGGTAKPTSGNSINTNGLGVPTGTRVATTTVTDFTSTAITAHDTLAMAVSTANTAKYVSATLTCVQ
jgi:hypothetical protein